MITPKKSNMHTSRDKMYQIKPGRSLIYLTKHGRIHLKRTHKTYQEKCSPAPLWNSNVRISKRYVFEQHRVKRVLLD